MDEWLLEARDRLAEGAGQSPESLDLSQAEIGDCVGVSTMHVSRIIRRSILQLQDVA